MSEGPYQEWAANRSDARFTEWLRHTAGEPWQEAVGHRFTEELGMGALEPATFRIYLVQDFVFLEHLVGAFGRAVADAPTMSTKRRLVGFLDVLTDEENDYFERAFDALDVEIETSMTVPTSGPTAAFVDLLEAASRMGGYAETLAVLVPAEWIYAEWATRVQSYETTDELPFYYREWVDLHATADFRSFVSWMRGQLDDIGPTHSIRRQQQIQRLFTRTVHLEVAFFDMAYADGAAR